MSAAAALVAELSQIGVKLVVRDGRIYAQPSRGLPPELRERVATQKSEIIALLTRDDRPGPTAPCYACRGTEFWALADVGRWVCAKCHRPDFEPERLVWAQARPAASPFGPGRPDEDCGVCEGSGVERLPHARWTICACRERDFHHDPARRRDAEGAS
jgi:hypothetical protein